MISVFKRFLETPPMHTSPHSGRHMTENKRTVYVPKRPLIETRLITNDADSAHFHRCTHRKMYSFYASDCITLFSGVAGPCKDLVPVHSLPILPQIWKSFWHIHHKHDEIANVSSVAILTQLVLPSFQLFPPVIYSSVR